MDIKAFLESWWMQLLIVPALPVAWLFIKRIVKKTPTQIDDQITEVIDEVIEDVKAGKEARNAEAVPQPVADAGEDRAAIDHP